jgi:hypothetical protein
MQKTFSLNNNFLKISVFIFRIIFLLTLPPDYGNHLQIIAPTAPVG